MTNPIAPDNGVHKPPAGSFPVAHRLLRGYAPAAVLILVVALVAILVPSKVPATSNTSSGGPSGAGSTATVNNSTTTTAAPGGTGTSTTAAGPATSGATSGGTAGKTVTIPGKVVACNGQSLQVPGDPYSPPCEQFSGSNGGVTATGVSANSITVAARLTTDQSFQQTLATLAGAQLQDTNADNQRTLNVLAEYFNSHFQFYGRKMNIKYYTGQGSLANELQGYGQANAEVDAKTAQSLGSFADITAESEPYATALWHDGIMGFGDPYMPNYWHEQHAPYDWSLATDGTDLATAVANYAVQKLCPAGSPATYAGGSLKGTGRKFASIVPENELYQVSGQVFQQIMGAHGCQVTGFQYSLDLGTESQQAANLVAQLKAQGFTTIICGCDPIFPVYLSGQAAQQSYLPEFVEIGAALVDQDYVGQLYNQSFYQHAIGISPNLATVPYTQTIGYAAYEAGCKEAPTLCNGQGPAFFVNNIYQQLDMLAIGIQMAGPNLTAASYQAGMYAYPPRLGPAGMWGFSSTQHTIPNDFREVCWNPNTVSPFNGKQGAYTQTSNQRWTADTVPKGPPGCPIPSS
ncbi:MAG TPA: hypothetical protein VNG12_03845 [Acidimicrobiales bacterium]|nr:hypothetical protein [Acidimicrobiales bacterium]